jgi:hypothetical protein
MVPEILVGLFTLSGVTLTMVIQKLFEKKNDENRFKRELSKEMFLKN